jgi:hypothetical protein
MTNLKQSNIFQMQELAFQFIRTVARKIDVWSVRFPITEEDYRCP